MTSEADESETMEVGCVVRLASGSPRMTVVRVVNDCCDCVWYDDGVRQFPFPKKALVLRCGSRDASESSDA